uniref:Uncharacterized protein n=1 Tax=Chromera velia CCMP2878 TaxID=1169474 RepID=A0A0G4GBG4_9ALVE|eukprot:Cvel_21143.t1-p1 / transcript=Cvel_21143.t1 / gene=Cvel_21143 / organism=Chromera_velia_CCMP2878 / gene_product=hypothetical protein / transcript_product=hypothetical protein / location=Cvel_scaffold1960:4141-6092(-) / protein_length=480 / sequence_SO=supercontig / SO=protein_coding / is_pseudo=false
MYRQILEGPNKTIARIQREKDHARHRSAVENTAISKTLALHLSEPPFLPHLGNNAKKLQLMEDRYLEIDRENKHLLQKMSDLVHKPSERSLIHMPKGPNSLNRDYRRRKLAQITQENHFLLHRIRGIQPRFSVQKLESDFQKNMAVAARHCNNPVVLRNVPNPRRVQLQPRSLRDLQGYSMTSLGHGQAHTVSTPQLGDKSLSERKIRTGSGKRSAQQKSSEMINIGGWKVPPDTKETSRLLMRGQKVSDAFCIVEISARPSAGGSSGAGGGTGLQVTVRDVQTDEISRLSISPSESRQLCSAFGGDLTELASNFHFRSLPTMQSSGGKAGGTRKSLIARAGDLVVGIPPEVRLHMQRMNEQAEAAAQRQEGDSNPSAFKLTADDMSKYSKALEAGDPGGEFQLSIAFPHPPISSHTPVAESGTSKSVQPGAGSLEGLDVQVRLQALGMGGDFTPQSVISRANSAGTNGTGRGYTPSPLN